MRYLKTYEQLLLSKSEKITTLHETKASLEQGIVKDSATVSETLQEEIKNKEALEQEMAELMALATNMTSQERALKKNLDKQYEERENFNKAIERILINAMSNSSASIATPVNKSTPAIVPSAPESNIERKRGFLPWPMSAATVTKRYGLQPHPTVPEIMIENKGVDLLSSNQNAVSYTHLTLPTTPYV